MSCDYSKLRGRIREFFGTQEKFAKAIGISCTSLSFRLTGKVDFLQSEIKKAAMLLHIHESEYAVYFFNEKV